MTTSRITSENDVLNGHSVLSVENWETEKNTEPTLVPSKFNNLLAGDKNHNWRVQSNVYN